jgi:four helix bundle protein
MKKSPLREKTYLFAIEVVLTYKMLTIEKREYVMSKQLLRSGTNPGAMIREAQSAESKADFIHKLKVAHKEISETIYWLELLTATKYLTENDFKNLNTPATEILRMLISSINTAKANR